MTRAIAVRQVETLRRVLESQARDLHVAMPGIVNSYDAASQTAEIQPAVRNVILARDEDEDEDTPVDLPILPSVPVCWPRAGSFYLHFPLSAGDSVLVIFSELDINAWRNSGDVSDPGLALRHMLSGAIAVPGLYPRTNPNGDADGTHGRIGYEGGASIEFRSGGAEIHAGGTKALAEEPNLDMHLNAISLDLDIIHAAAIGGPSPNYGSAARTSLKGASPIPTSILKGD